MSRVKEGFIHKPHIHCIGIGGIGMSSLAQWFSAHNWSVSGSDTTESIITKDLTKHGIRVKIGQKRASLPKRVDLVVVSQAIRANNADYRAARMQSIPIRTYPEIIGILTRMVPTIAVAGSHGKSSTTALLALALKRAHLDPMVIIGTRVPELSHNNYRHGHGPLVLEADEYGRAFLHYAPRVAIITTIDREHLDTYGSLANLKRAFLGFVEGIAPHGTLIANRDDRHLRALKSRIGEIARDRQLHVIWYSLTDPVTKRIRIILSVPGTHNLQNALAAYHAARRAGATTTDILTTFANYRGAWRRMEHRGMFHGARVIDDYAHHPTEIQATLHAIRKANPGMQIVCVFQPHQEYRLNHLFSDFAKAFQDADRVIILPTYRVSGRDHQEQKMSRTAHDLARTITRRKRHSSVVQYCARPASLGALLVKTPTLLRSIIVMMGAGDITKHTDSLIKNTAS